MKCDCSGLEEISEFNSIHEFERFQRYLEGLISSGELVEVGVSKYYAGFSEQWYRCKKCRKKWRLVHPDFPFRGFFKRVPLFGNDKRW